MKRSIPLDSWRMALRQHSLVAKSGFAPKTADEILASGCEIIDASVPGNLELDLIRAGKLPEDIFFGTNILQVQKYESTHLWYFTSFHLEETEDDAFLLFEGIDTASEIYVDGKLLGKTENMLIPYEFPLYGMVPGQHELVVHIIPASVYSRNKSMNVNCLSLRYNCDSLYIRKAPYMYGWDIMPRTVSAGLWRPVSVVYKPQHRIAEQFLKTILVSKEKARLQLNLRIHSDADDVKDFTVKVRGICGDSVFEAQQSCWSFHERLFVDVANPQLWWPKNYGAPNLYKVEITLLRKGEICDQVSFQYGIRTVELIRTSFAGSDGDFHFKVNGKKIFVLGTNWVPTDAFPSRHDAYTIRGLELTNQLGCNMIRCWGGNAYPGDLFYDYCDSHGILVWQDFAMACGIYPDDPHFQELLRQEGESVVARLREHPCIALWSGDNECDQFYSDSAIRQDDHLISILDPNDNILTRKILPEVTSRMDGTRPFLPSSPYYDRAVFANMHDPSQPRRKPAEDHLWGPRDYFKGDFYYTNSVCHFASETGYHGCPSPETLKKIIGADHLANIGDGKLCDDAHWLVHAANPQSTPDGAYAYRIPLMTRQVERLFGKAPADIHDYALESQISQAEAKKFFVEHFRIEKWYRTGIIWWNIIDGWPQISDAVVDWYGTKKLAYHYIAASQSPFCMLCDEPDETGNLTLCAANDTREAVTVRYQVTDALTGEEITSGCCTVGSDETAQIAKLPEKAGAFYLICWDGDQTGCNHFTCRIGDGIRLEDYVAFMKKVGYYDKLEGF